MIEQNEACDAHIRLKTGSDIHLMLKSIHGGDLNMTAKKCIITSVSKMKKKYKETIKWK